VNAILSETIGQIVKQYDDALTNFVFETWNNPHAGAVDFRREHREMIRTLGRQAYYEGMREAGIANPEADADYDDELAIRQWINEQLQYVNGFATAVIEAALDAALRRGILDRVRWWVESMRAIGNLGYANTKRNEPGTWRMNFVRGTKEHCRTCAWLEGQRHRLKWYVQKGYVPRRPGNPNLDCGGWLCGCGVVSDQGRLLL
jgi:hypothetical protein